MRPRWWPTSRLPCIRLGGRPLQQVRADERAGPGPRTAPASRRAAAESGNRDGRSRSPSGSFASTRSAARRHGACASARSRGARPPRGWGNATGREIGVGLPVGAADHQRRWGSLHARWPRSARLAAHPVQGCGKRPAQGHRGGPRKRRLAGPDGGRFPGLNALPRAGEAAGQGSCGAGELPRWGAVGLGSCRRGSCRRGSCRPGGETAGRTGNAANDGRRGRPAPPRRRGRGEPGGPSRGPGPGIRDSGPPGPANRRPSILRVDRRHKSVRPSPR